MTQDEMDSPRPQAPPWGDEDGFGLVEAIVAILVMSVGLLAVAGMTLAVAQQSRASTYMTEQTVVGQELMEYYVDEGFAGLTVGTVDTSVSMGPRTYDVDVAVTDVGPRTRRIDVTVSGHENTSPTSLSTLVHRLRSVPEEYTP